MLGISLESEAWKHASYQPDSLPEFKLRSGSLKWSPNIKDLAFQCHMYDAIFEVVMTTFSQAINGEI